MAEGIVQVTEGSGKKLHTWDRTIGANLVQDELVLMSEPHLATYTAMAVQISNATALAHIIQIMAGASLTVFIRRIRVWQFDAATTAAIKSISIVRLTTAGTGGTSVTPLALDTTDGAAGATAMTLPTVKGTEASGTISLVPGMFIQTVPTGGPVAAPLLADWDFDRLRSKGLRIPAGTSNGIAVKNVSAVAAATCIVEVTFSEAPAGY